MSIVTVKFQEAQDNMKKEKSSVVVVQREGYYKVQELKRLQIYQKKIIQENEEFIN